ncbi:MAG: HNH endonuclease [Bacteroidetes bacterium]|nr:HNH endonuclease [Bacteroidota bacterium]
MSEKYLSKETKQLVRRRANNICEYCLAIGDYAFHPFSIDHIIPSSEGGDDELSNLALACQHCNNCKYNKTTAIDPLNDLEVHLYHPRQDKWEEHFVWNEDKTIILGISPIGRGTISCLKINREEAVNLRKALKMFGVHPPKKF